MRPACLSLGEAHSSQLLVSALTALLKALTQDALAALHGWLLWGAKAAGPSMNQQLFLAHATGLIMLLSCFTTITSSKHHTTWRCRLSDSVCPLSQTWHC